MASMEIEEPMDQSQQPDEEMKSRRVLQMKKTLNRCLDASFAKFSKKDVKKCFDQDLLKNHGDLIYNYCNQVVNKVRQNIAEEFETICEESHVYQHLAQLDEIAEQQPQFPNGNRLAPFPEESIVLRARKLAVNIKQAEKERLQQLLNVMEQENQQLRANLEAQRHSANQLAQHLTTQANHLENASSVTWKWN